MSEGEAEAGYIFVSLDSDEKPEKLNRSRRIVGEAREAASHQIRSKRSGPSITRSNVCEDFGRRGGWLRSRSWPSFWLLNVPLSSLIVDLINTVVWIGSTNDLPHPDWPIEIFPHD